MSDGTEKIWKMNPANQKMIDYVNVYSGSSKIKSVNELEYINGKIYCNIWQKDAIAVVNPENGKVELNGINLKRYDLNSLRENIGFVSQNPSLFSDTVKNNILIGKEDASDEEIASRTFKTISSSLS